MPTKTVETKQDLKICHRCSGEIFFSNHDTGVTRDSEHASRHTQQLDSQCRIENFSIKLKLLAYRKDELKRNQRGSSKQICLCWAVQGPCLGILQSSSGFVSSVVSCDLVGAWWLPGSQCIAKGVGIVRTPGEERCHNSQGRRRMQKEGRVWSE